MNTTDSAVRIIHRPTGIKVECQEERSQLQNREKAMRYLRARLLQKAQDEAQAKEAAARRSQLGTGERSEKIRTYNFPDGRVTDHRIKYTSHQLQDVLAGGEELDGFVDRLNAAERAAQLSEGDAEAPDASRRGRPPRRPGTWNATASSQPLATAEVLLAYVLGTDRAGLYLREEGLSTAEARRFGRALCRRCTGTPLQHLTGEQGFRRLVLEVRPGVFIPRPETEVLVDVALAAIDDARGAASWSTSAPGPARSRSRSRRNTPARGWSRPTRRPRPWRWRARTPGGSASTIDVREGDLLAPLAGRARGRGRPGREQPAVRRAGRVRGAAAPRCGPIPRLALVGGIEMLRAAVRAGGRVAAARRRGRGRDR